MYYMVEFLTMLDGDTGTVLVQEDKLAPLLLNYDRALYKVLNVASIGNITLDYTVFLRKDAHLEHGETSNS